jgi:hypothetical protein
MVPTILCGEASMISIPIFWSKAPRPRSFKAAKFSSLNLLPLLSALICQSYALNLGSRYGEIEFTKLAKLIKRATATFARWPFNGISGISRIAGRKLQNFNWISHKCGIWIHHDVA